MFNELMLLAITYHLPLITDFNLSDELAINTGFSLNFFVITIIVVHLMSILYKEFKRL